MSQGSFPIASAANQFVLPLFSSLPSPWPLPPKPTMTQSPLWSALVDRQRRVIRAEEEEHQELRDLADSLRWKLIQAKKKRTQRESVLGMSPKPGEGLLELGAAPMAATKSLSLWCCLNWFLSAASAQMNSSRQEPLHR